MSSCLVSCTKIKTSLPSVARQSCFTLVASWVMTSALKLLLDSTKLKKIALLCPCNQSATFFCHLIGHFCHYRSLIKIGFLYAWEIYARQYPVAQLHLTKMYDFSRFPGGGGGFNNFVIVCLYPLFMRTLFMNSLTCALIFSSILSPLCKILVTAERIFPAPTSHLSWHQCTFAFLPWSRIYQREIIGCFGDLLRMRNQFSQISYSSASSVATVSLLQSGHSALSS